MLEIKLSKQADRFLRKCEKVLYDRIISKIKELKENPVPHDAKRIVGHKELIFRIRIGKYRALYEIDHKERIVLIMKVDHREKVYG